MNVEEITFIISITLGLSLSSLRPRVRVPDIGEKLANKRPAIASIPKASSITGFTL